MRSERKYFEFCTENADLFRVSEDIMQVDQYMLEDKNLTGIEDIEEYIEKTWTSNENFLTHGFGFVYVMNHEIVSWCISDGVRKQRCEIGVETNMGFRRKGYGLQVVQAALNYCRENEISQVGWHCWSSNIASYKLAEKAGFKQQISVPVYFGWYNALDNYLINGNHYLNEKKDYETAADFYSRALDQGYGMEWHFYNCACAYWKTGKKEKAKAYWKTALERGWKGIHNVRDSWFYEYVYRETDAAMIEIELSV